MQVIGAIGIVLGIVALAIPFLGSMGSCGPFVDAICDMRCSDNQCTESEKQAPWREGKTCEDLGVRRSQGLRFFFGARKYRIVAVFQLRSEVPH